MGESSYSNVRMKQSLEEGMKAFTDNTSKEELEAMSSLTQSKDRAQTTATSALSLSLIVVLKELIDRGPEGSKYYLASLILVSLCLVLQVVIGVLAIYMYQLRINISKKGQTPLKSWSSLTRKLPSTDKFNKETQVQDVSELKSQTQNERLEENSAEATDNPAFQASSEIATNTLAMGNATPISIGRESHSNSAVGLSRQVDIEYEKTRCCGSLHKCFSGPLDVTPLEEITWKLQHILTEQLSEVFLEIQEIQSKLINTIDGTDAATLQDNIVVKFQSVQVIGAQMKILEDRGRAAARKRNYEKVAKIQNVITYLLYATFVLNAFLIGFGISSNGASN